MADPKSQQDAQSATGAIEVTDLDSLLKKEFKPKTDEAKEAVERAVRTPPSDTRAYFRGECIRRYPDEVFGVNWDSISFNVGDEPIKRILMNEPLKGTRAHVEELLDASPTAQILVRNLTAS